MPRGARGSKGNVVAQRARRAARKRAAEAQLVLAARECVARAAIPPPSTPEVVNPANPAGHQARKPPRKTPQIFITRDRAPKSRSVYSLRELAIEAGQKRTAEQAHLELANREKRRRDLAATSSSGQAVQNLTPNPAVQVQAKSSEQDRLGIVDREQHDRRPIVAPPRRDSAVDPVQKETTNQGQLGSAASGQAADIALLLNVAVESPARTLGRRISNIQLNSRSENMTGGSFLPQQVADGDAAKLDKDILAAAIFAPAPPFDKDEEGLQDRDDFLRDAIANVEVHHEKVRANIVASWSTQNQDVERQLESVLNATCQPEDDEKAARIATMLANISTPYKVEDGSSTLILIGELWIGEVALEEAVVLILEGPATEISLWASHQSLGREVPSLFPLYEEV
ncbi:uncharacterized protein BDZ99DRAFT_284623 [Mytilinidion resinicola]|uniref:Uncharacterized protein n=1 Tax=Mytilinidion resinicola TaxID=574789 RepID=A0A6A6YVF7_9PEZI|nr:uncharacterized protein BDZ99DRAFT_284623 [Mytilinidion resinicola]KAF2811974.1 hypothetical protein BDZ99DRAFT_284623 [Mytilinidion resinicola]